MKQGILYSKWQLKPFLVKSTFRALLMNNTWPFFKVLQKPICLQKLHFSITIWCTSLLFLATTFPTCLVGGNKRKNVGRKDRTSGGTEAWSLSNGDYVEDPKCFSNAQADVELCRGRRGKGSGTSSSNQTAIIVPQTSISQCYEYTKSCPFYSTLLRNRLLMFTGMCIM